MNVKSAESNTPSNMELSEASLDAGKLGIYLLGIVFLIGFISELGALGANLAVFLLEISFVFACLFRKNFSFALKKIYKKNKLIFVVIGAWFFWACLSFINAISVYELMPLLGSLVRLSEYAGHILFTVFLIGFFNSVKINPDKLLLLIPITALLIAFNLLVAWQLHPEIHSDTLWIDTPPFYMNIRQAGFHCSVGILVFFAMLQKDVMSFQKTSFLIALLVATTTFLFWTGGRASAAATYLTIVVWLIVLLVYRQPIKRLCLVLVLSVICALVLSEMLSVMPWNGLFSAVSRSIESNNLERLTSGRLEVWSFAWEKIKTYPLLGLSAQSYSLAEGSPLHFQPHNSVIQFAMNWGIPGAILSFSVLLLSFFKGLERYKNGFSVYSACGGLIIISSLMTSMLDGSLYHGQTSFYLAFGYALWLSEKGLSKEQLPKSSHSINEIL